MKTTMTNHLARALLAIASLVGFGSASAESPTCSGNEQLLSWPTVNPIWEMCYLRPSQSSGPDGSGLELRNVYLHGRLALKRAHAPMLFAEYTTSTCYRDWKNTDTAGRIINWSANHPTFLRKTTTSCDRSNSPTQSYGGNCPYGVPIAGGSGNPTGTCVEGVVIDDQGSYVELTAQYNAAWYYYTSRFRFHADGSFEPEFGFGNRDGTNNNITHWHHNYWRLDFDIEGAANDVIAENNVVQPTEFATLRCNASTTPSCVQERLWQVRDTVTGRGFQLMPSVDDYKTPTNQSGRNFHLKDVFGTAYSPTEFGDRPDNDLGDCAMSDTALANGADLDGASGEGTDVVMYYRTGVRDRTNEGPGTQDSMVCKHGGPMFTPIGNWRPSLFENGFE